jgi:hypothetical protein
MASGSVLVLALARKSETETLSKDDEGEQRAGDQRAEQARRCRLRKMRNRDAPSVSAASSMAMSARAKLATSVRNRNGMSHQPHPPRRPAADRAPAARPPA